LLLRNRGEKVTAIVEGAGIARLRVFTAKQALATYVRTDGAMELTRGGSRAALGIISDITGKTYKRGMAGKVEALRDAEAILEWEG
jgi:hypothetical protein